MASRWGVLHEMSLANADAALEAGDMAAAMQWLDTVPVSARPPKLLAKCHESSARLRAASSAWAAAAEEMRLACSYEATPLRQRRLALLRARRPLITDHEWAVITAATPPPSSLNTKSLAPEVEAVHACGAYHSRGRSSGAPWSRYLRLSKEPPAEDEDRRAIFRLAAGYLVRCIAERTDILQRAEVAVPIPANPERYARRLASLPDELAIGCEKGLAIVSLPYALEWAPDSIDVEMKRLGRAQRRQHADSLFRPGADIDQVAGRGVLLVDDLTTTGTTFRAAARKLLAAGAKCVDACALSHTEG